MPLKKCPKGHSYDPSVYGDNCPFCPSTPGSNPLGHPNTSTYGPAPDDPPTQIIQPGPSPTPPGNDSTVVIEPGQGVYDEPHTKIHQVEQTDDVRKPGDTRKLVGILYTYSKTVNENGEIFRIYEGKTTVGKGDGCKIVIKNDEEISKEHFTILCRNIEGQPLKFYMKDSMSTNGTFLNGNIEDEQVELKSSDVIRIGSTELTFIILAN